MHFPNKMILTRFLYTKDEVELSLITALLKKEDLKIIYYWAYELYYSGFEVELFELLWKIYLDFYYIYQPYFAIYLKKKYKLWKDDNDMKHVAYILRNMYNLKASGNVFLIRQRFALATGPTVLYRYKYKNPLYLTGYDKPYHNLLLSLERKHFENSLYHLKVLLDKGHSLNEISAVVASFLKIDIVNDYVSIHYLQAVICKALFADIDKKELQSNEIHKQIYVVPKQEDIDEMIRLEKETIPLTQKGNAQVYNTLLFKRMVSIDDHIGSFALQRWKCGDFIKEQWFHWEYYAMGSPLWSARLRQYCGIINHISKKIEFACEKNEEAFYDLYAYELDELPKEVQAMSMKPLLEKNGDVWFNYVFGIVQGQCDEITCHESMCDEITCENREKDSIWQWDY